ncbi:PAS domain-containing protein [Loktanella sp. 5RATIMAR09]|uniref:PAS domain-containing protein n=1 Tax=Loktanella sp. 5RATIMAR09 TaxID=1225655 RepID=UPI000B0420BF|nr:PAS domain-containing protein [Loktanella sp. 5RATIMAR09]
MSKDISDDLMQRRRGDMPGHNDLILKNLEQYWQTLRHAQRLPARNDVAPSQIDDALPHAFILQRVAPGTARFRVAGQRLHDLLKMDARGMPFSTVLLPEARDQAQALLESAFSSPAIVSIPLISPATLLRPALRGTVLLLPLRDSDDNTTRILGALVTDPDTTNRPRRFAINTAERIRHERIGLRLAPTPLFPTQPSKRPDAVVRPALRLVVNNG